MKNWPNKAIWTGDNIEIMRGMNSDSVDLIYLDPPFNSKANYAAPIGSKAAGAAFKDTWSLSDVDAEWINLIEAKYAALHRVLLAAMNDSDKSYLAYMAVRLLEMHRILKPSGSIYLHCDPTMSHYLKLLMDSIFEKRNFQNEIIWCYSTGGKGKKRWARKHDVILFYSKDIEWTFNYKDVRVPMKSGKSSFGGKFETDEDGRKYRLVYGSKNAVGETRYYKYYLDEGKVPEDYWSDINSLQSSVKERTGYPTQKPIALLDRIIKASSNKGDVVFDPFCGCATTLVSADACDRNWMGIDISPKAAELVVTRIENYQGLWRDIVHRSDIPKRTDLGKLPNYQTHKPTLYGQQGGNCTGCSIHFELRHLEVDHIISRKKGGTDHIDNLQLLCGSCNRIKGDRGMEYLRTKLQI